MTTAIGWSAAINAYITAMRAAGRSPNTIRLHRHYLSGLAAEHDRPGLVRTSDLETALSVVHWAPETRKSARSVFRRFYGWLHKSGLADHDPAARLEAVRVPPALPRPAPERVILQTIARAERRTRLMLMLAAYAGLRCAEIAAVHADHLVGDVLYVVGKGGKARQVPVVQPELLAALRLVDGFAFPGGTVGHLSPSHVSRVVSRALPKGWTAHTLRHRMATVAYAGTRDLLAVGAVLGHSRPETTQRYVRMPDDALRAAVAAAAA